MVSFFNILDDTRIGHPRTPVSMELFSPSSVQIKVNLNTTGLKVYISVTT